MDDIIAGERMQDLGRERERRNRLPGLWTTLGYQLLDFGPGRARIGWQATPEYGFPTEGGYVVQGGLVTALLDAAMGNACWTTLDRDQVFLTVDLRVEFLRPSRPGMLVASGTVIRRTRRVVFCAADLHDSDGVLLASSRCTQTVLPASGAAGRSGGADSGDELTEGRG
jgi:uncharacterized protein (TIGR00369 family)